MAKQVSVTIEEKEFAAKYPEIALMHLSMSDKIRVALGFKARSKKAGAPKGNRNAEGNKGRWNNRDSFNPL